MVWEGEGEGGDLGFSYSSFASGILFFTLFHFPFSGNSYFLKVHGIRFVFGISLLSVR